MELPFELYENHKKKTKYRWKRRGLITDKFEEIYKQYIYSSNCELCGNKYKSRKDRHMEHCHTTGKFRNICCCSCNGRKRDKKIPSNNTTGYKCICKQNRPDYKQGFIWKFEVNVDGKRKQIKTSVNLEKLVEFRDLWFKENNYHT